MKNSAGKIIGFVAGLAGFLILFKLIILNHTTPDDELAPGIVVIAAVLSGIFFGFIGNLMQSRFKNS
ncbi:MAG: hypothetical protein V4721_18100 [Bacteroidota bacterium]